MPVLPPCCGADLQGIQRAFAEVLGEELQLSFVISGTRDIDQPMVFVSPSFCTMTGYSPKELLGRNCRLLQGPGTSRVTVSKLRDAIMEERAVSVCLLNHRKDSTPFWNALHIAPCHDASSRLLYYVGIQADVTRLVEAAAAAERVPAPTSAAAAEVVAEGASEGTAAEGAPPLQPSAVERELELEACHAERIAEQLHAHAAELPATVPRCAAADVLPASMLCALSKLQEAFVLADPNLPGCPLEYASPSFLHLTGYPRHEVLGRNCSFLQLCPADAQPGAAAATAAAAEANCEQLAVLRAALGASPPRAVTCVLHNFKRCGMPFLNVLHVAPIRDAGGKVHYFIGVQTELKGPARAALAAASAAAEAERPAALGGDALSSVCPLLLLRQKSVTGQVKVCVRSLAGAEGVAGSEQGLRRLVPFQHPPRAASPSLVRE